MEEVSIVQDINMQSSSPDIVDHRRRRFGASSCAGLDRRQQIIAPPWVA
jgi:hypothetical protein